MTARTIDFTKKAQRQLLKLPADIQRRTVAAIDELQHPITDRRKASKFQGQKKNEPATYRLRVGTHRVLYAVTKDDPQVIILHIGPRSTAYRKRK